MPFKRIELFIVISIENKPSHIKNFFRKGLKKSVIKILFRKGLSNSSLSYFSRKGLTNPSKKGEAQKTGTLGEVRPLNTSPKWGQNFLVKGLTKSVVKILI